MDLTNKVYSRLHDLRKEKGVTIADMSKSIGISASAVSNYERGIRCPDADTLIKFAEYFDCSVDYLLGLDSLKNNKEREKLSEITEASEELYDELNDYYKKKFEDLKRIILVSFTLASDDPDNDNKNFFDDYIDFLGYMSAFFCTRYGLFVPEYFEDGAPKNEQERIQTLLVTAFELKNGAENLIYDTIGLAETEEAEAQFALDYERYKRFIFSDDFDKK